MVLEKLVQKLKYLIQQHLLDLEILEDLVDHLKVLVVLVDPHYLENLRFQEFHHLHLYLVVLVDQQQ